MSCLADQLDELKKQLEYERVQNREQVNKELSNVKLQVEETRSGLQARQNQVEAVVMEVLFMVLLTILV